MTTEKQKKRGWLIPENPFPETTICVQFEIPNDPLYIANVKGAIWKLAQWFNWEKSYEPTDTRARDVSELFRELLYQTLSFSEDCGEGVTMFQLRQNPSNPCQLQQSLNGGDSWILAFDYSLCDAFSGGGTTINISIAQTYIQDLRTQYDIDINLIGARLLPDDDWTNIALCHALAVMIRGIIVGALERLRSGNNQEMVIQAIAGGIAIASAFIFGTPFAGFATAIGVAVGLVSNAIMNELEENQLEDALEDAQTIFQLQCCAYASIVGTKPTLTTFGEMFDGCGTLSTLATELLPLMQSAVENFDLFLTFLEGANQAYEYAEQGILGNDCDSCLDVCWDFTETGAMTILYGYIDPAQGNPEPSLHSASGINSGVYPLNGAGTSTGITPAVRIDFSAPRNITEISYQYLMNASGTIAMVRGYEIRQFGTNALISRVTGAVNHNDSTWKTWTVSGLSHTNVGAIVVWISKTSDPATTGEALIDNVCAL